MSEDIIKELLEKLKQCDDFHNRCDFLMEHSEITYMLDYITNLQQENQSLKKENKILRENAEHNDKVVDKVNWENQKLKKQLEEYKRLGFEHLNDKCNKLEKQRKEFIDYINSYIKLLSDDPDYIEERQKDILEEILSKYKESGEQ